MGQLGRAGHAVTALALVTAYLLLAIESIATWNPVLPYGTKTFILPSIYPSF